VSPSLPRSRRALVVGGIAAVVTVAGAGFAYAATTASAPAAPSSAASSATAHSGTAAKHKPKHRRAEDLVTAVSGSSVTVDTPNGSKTFALTSTTSYHRGKTKATAQDVKVGEMVRIRAAKNAGTPTARIVTIAPAVLTGYVRSISGGTLTVVDESGFTRKITTSGGTAYRKNGAAGSAGDVSVGSLVHVRGIVASDGTSIDATSVGVHSR
jgi:hypothetical protein